MTTGTDTLLKTSDYKSENRPIWCPGCGDYGALGSLTKAMADLQLNPVKTVFVSGIGCSSRLPGFVNAYGFHGVHGRALAVAQGVKLANPELTVISVGGDGDGLSIGGNHFMHAVRRNVNMTYVMLDNRIYGLTKGQDSPTTEPGRVTKASPYGHLEQPIDPVALALSIGASFVARGYSAKPKELSYLIREAIAHPGFAFVHALSPCVTFNRDFSFEKIDAMLADLPAEHDPNDRADAVRLALADTLYLGIFVRDESKPEYVQVVEQMRERVGSKSGAVDIQRIVQQFC